LAKKLSTSLILRGAQRLAVLENKMLREVFGRTEDGVIGGRSKVHNGELYNLFAYLHPVFPSFHITMLKITKGQYL
jgi:hypothetical protein